MEDWRGSDFTNFPTMGNPMDKIQKAIKMAKRGNASEKPSVRFGGDAVVIVGTYKEKQLAWIKKHGVYNYPIKEEDELRPESCAKVKELWLYASAKVKRCCFSAEFVGIQSRDEFLAANPTYAKLGPSKHARYMVFKTTFLEYGPCLEGAAVFARVSDFEKGRGRTKKIAAAIKQFHADGDFGLLADYLPNDLAKLPREQLRVCEAGVQMDFMSIILPGEEKFSNGVCPKYRVASLFAGCGGLDLGFQGGFEFLGKKYAQTGFGVCWANEINPAACKTYSRNLGADIICGDIKDVIETMPREVDVVMGGFPCQDISINGKMLGIKGRRSCLYTYIIDAVKKTNPKVFVAENVGSLMLKQNEYSLKTILNDFKSLGYDVTYHVYHAEDYGVPQTRERVIFVGTRKDIGKFTVPAPLDVPAVTAGEALRDLENAPQSKEFSHVWSMAAPSGEQGSRRLVESRPGYTIRAECHGNIQFHYRLPRRISMREAARIQSFPDSFMFPCGIRETERQIGNAVPPVLAWHVAMAVKRTLEGGHE